MSPRPLAWGILGAGNIAGKFAHDVSAIRDHARLCAVGARDDGRARAFAAAYGVERAYGSYQAVLDDPAVEVVYVSLLNNDHAEWSIRAARAGKHVLCEKPAVMTAMELERVLEAARTHDVFFMEAFAYRCHPRIAQLAALIVSRPIGEVRMAHSTFAFDGDRLDRPRLWARDQGGGSLMDVGVYPLSWLRMVARFLGLGEPDAACATGHLRASGVDEWAAGALRFPGGFTASFVCGARCLQPNAAAIYGSEGWIEVVDPWRSTPGTAAFVVHRHDAPDRRIACDDPMPRFAREARVVSESIARRQSPACDWEDSRGQARLLDRLRAQLGVRWPGE